MPADLLGAAQRRGTTAVATARSSASATARPRCWPRRAASSGARSWRRIGARALAIARRSDGASGRISTATCLTDEGEQQAHQVLRERPRARRRRDDTAWVPTSRDDQAPRSRWSTSTASGRGGASPTCAQATVCRSPSAARRRAERVALPPLSETTGWAASTTSRAPSTMTAELAELVGYFMGDGSLHSRGLRFCVAPRTSTWSTTSSGSPRSCSASRPLVEPAGRYVEVDDQLGAARRMVAGLRASPSTCPREGHTRQGLDAAHP